MARTTSSLALPPRIQTHVVFLGTYGRLCLAATLHGIATGSLNKESGLLWESHALLRIAGCMWLLAQAAVLAMTLAPGRGYPRTAFAETMLSGVCPFVADSFDTLKDLEDVLFGGFCWQSANAGIQAMGSESWAYLLAFHVYCMLVPNPYVLTEFTASHLSLFAIRSIDATSRPQSSRGLSHADQIWPS